MRPIRCLYVSGPMTGLPELNFPAFRAAAKALNRAGYMVVNPVDVNPDPTTSRYDCMRNDLRALADCDGMALLPGWEHSPGANRELHNALAMGFVVAPLDAWLAGAEAECVNGGDKCALVGEGVRCPAGQGCPWKGKST